MRTVGFLVSVALVWCGGYLCGTGDMGEWLRNKAGRHCVELPAPHRSVHRP